MNAIARDAGAVRATRLIRLRRDGQMPLRLTGRCIARHDGRVERAALWHDLALYRAEPDGYAPGCYAPGGYAVEIAAMLASAAVPVAVRCHAIWTASLDAALVCLERHDAAQDLCPGVSAPGVALEDVALSASELLMQAASLRCARDDVVRRYGIGVGAFLLALAAETGSRDL